jgi:thiol-disulfide isomerase/thioredoxin
MKQFWLGWLLAAQVAFGAEPLLKGTNFNEYRLKDFVEPETKAVVLVFSSIHCPLLRQYIPTLTELNREYGPKGVVFLGIYSDKSATAFSMAEHALKYDIPFRVLQDQESLLAKKLGATTLTETIVLDPKLQVLYQGAIDDQYTVVSRLPAPRKTFLKNALNEILSNKPVSEPSSIASGCTIELHDPDEKPEPKTYYEDVAPIIQAKCQVCHRPGGPGAVFDTFMDYDTVAMHADTIRQVVVDGRMPPSYTVMNHKFGKLSNDRRLTKDEVKTIDHWARGGAQAGDPAKAPKPIEWKAPEWRIGKPDVVLQMDKPFVLPATGILDYKFFKLKLNYPVDKWVQAVEFQPGNNEVVHHSELHIVKSDNEDYSGTGGMMKVYGITGDKAVMLNGYVPGDDDDNARVYPPGQAMRIPKGHDLVLEMHYTTTGKATSDRSRVGLKFASAPPKEELCTHAFRQPRSKLWVAAHDGHAVNQREIWFRKDVLVYSLRAHMHQIGKQWKLEWVTPAPEDTPGLPAVKEFLAGVPSWNFGWQRSFDLQKPILVPAGQVILMTGVWDNSRHNPWAKDPSVPKEWGIQTEDEMLNTRVKFSIVPKNGKTVSCMEAVP